MKNPVRLGIVVLISLCMLTSCGEKERTSGDSSNKKAKVIQSNESDIDQWVPNLAVVLRDNEVSPSDTLIYQELESQTGVVIDWITAPDAGWAEKRSLLFASGELPDAFFGNAILTDEDVLKYGSQGLLISLEDYMTPEIMPNLSKVFEDYPEYLAAITAPDGHIYGLPSFDEGMVTTTNWPLYVNQNWLNAIDMDPPTTTEEFYEMLLAFKEHDVNGNGNPEDEIPYSFQKATNYCSDMFGAFGIIDNTKTHIDVKEGQVYYTATTDGYKEAIKYFHRLFEEGLLDQEAFTHDSKAFKAKEMSEERILGSFQAWRSNQWAVADGDNSYIPIKPLIGPNGDQLWPERYNGIKYRGSFAITKNASDPEYLMRWVDNIYDPLFGLQTSFALKVGVHIEDTDNDGKYETLMKATKENRTGIITQGLERIDNVTKEASEMLEEKPAHIIEKQMLDQYYSPYYKEEYYPKVFFTLEEVRQLSTLKTDIIGYTNEMYARWMMTGGIEEEWDNYVAKLNKMGVDDYVSIYQNAMDRFVEQNND